ncbi:glycoside hydrolase family 38 N-terminal domain-containing protein [Vagococcus vulneris]|uniref:Alpha-mannosidase n=1 Tax=Vagococcus vulneris TaxID=1977869 RepID=A0A429ZYV8_9ENTE|nr:glycoside hydrolase family 38 C-terminal domain-containing protein [Vagococcus vulneris]RST99171.1 alpha-mannosidase [Vagococcus vulneris]
MVKGYIVQHTHWDREWYFTAEDAKVLSDQVFTEALNELEKNPNVNFCLDGQSSILDEYLEINPQKLQVIKDLVAKGRLFVGPWYTQTDALLVDSESILRNLIIGINETKEKYGNPMMVGYLPDTFGFNANLPTLLNQVGIDNFMAWRGINFDKQAFSPYFIWNGLGDQYVYAMYFPFGYMTGLMTLDAVNNIPNFVENRLDPMLSFLMEHGDNEDLLLPSGIDQKSMVLDFDNIVEQINEVSDYENEICDYPTYVEIIRNKKNLPNYEGELREPVYSRVHRSISSVRTQMKQDNFQLEQIILHRIEPLMVISKKIGVEISTGLLKRLWKKVLENQAHDSIGGCVSDNVAEDIFHRSKEAYELAEGLENLISKRIADSLDLTHHQLLVFNTDPVPFKGEKIVHVVNRTKNIRFKNSKKSVLVSEKYYPERHNVQRLVATGFEYFTEPSYYELDICIDVELPAFGYTIIEFEECEEPLETSVWSEETRISNDFYTIQYHAGTVELVTKEGRTIKDFIRLVDMGNNGDTYDFSPLAEEKELILDFDKAHVERDSSKQCLVIEGVASLPNDLESRCLEKQNIIEVAYILRLTLNDEDVIEGKITIDNQVLSHRMRLQFQVDDPTEISIAQIQNGFVINQPEVIPSDWVEKYVEMPANLEIFDKSVSVEFEGSYVTVFADGLREYERVSDKLFLTLFATTGELGKPNLSWRPGRASGDTTNEGHVMMPTPLAQELGEHQYSFAIQVGKGRLDQFKVAKTTQKRLSQSVSYQKQSLNLFINRLDNKIWPLQHSKRVPTELSLLELPKDVIVSAIYPAYSEENSYVIRLANPTKETVELTDRVTLKGKIVNALEEDVGQVNNIKPFDYVSLLIPINKYS